MMIPIRVLLIIGGPLLFGLLFVVYLNKRINEDYGMFWVTLSTAMLLSGIFKKNWGAFTYIDSSHEVFIIIVIVIFALLLFCMTSSLSILKRRNQELAMQISLIYNELEECKDRENTENEEDTVCDQYIGESRSGAGTDQSS